MVDELQIKHNPGLVTDSGETIFEYVLKGRTLQFELEEGVARPTIHSFLLAGNLAVQAGDSVIDIGSGCGFVGVAAAACYGADSVTATDVNRKSIVLIGRNAHHNGVGSQVSPLECDLFEGVQGKTFKVIVSNPPQSPIPPEREQLERLSSQSVFASTFSGPDGLGHVRQIIQQAQAYLAPGGKLQLALHQFLGMEKVMKLFEAHGYRVEITSTDAATMSPTTKSLQAYIESVLGYSFPHTVEGVTYTKISVVTASRSRESASRR